MYLDDPELDPVRRAGPLQGTSRLAIARALYLENQLRDRQRARRGLAAWLAMMWRRGHPAAAAPDATATRPLSPRTSGSG